MQDQELISLVKNNLNIADETKDIIISDIIVETQNYCNLKELPIESEPFIRKKVKGILDYEALNGSNSVFDIKSIKEGDTSITYNVDEKTSKETIYGLSKEDKRNLAKFRRTRK